jgi:TolB protein
MPRIVISVATAALAFAAGSTAAVAAGRLYFTLYPHRVGVEIAWVDLSSPRTEHVVHWLIGAADPAWSPDAKRLAFVNPRGLYVANADGSNLQRLASTAHPNAAVADPSWSPDGRRLAYDVGGLHPSVFVVDADGSGRHRIASGQAPSWSPDGRLIAFESGPIGEWQLFVVSPNGHGLRRLTNMGSVQSEMPSWSPDGHRIAFVVQRGVDSQIGLVSADGSGWRQLTRGPSLSTTPSWSPDGRWLVFSRGPRYGVFQLYRMRPTGSGLHQLTFGRLTAQSPDWQPATG